MAVRAAWFIAAFLALCGGLVLFPWIDLATSALFVAPGGGFAFGGWAPFRILHAAPPYLDAAIILAGVALLVAALPGRPWRGLDHRAGLFLLLALAVGPGLIVNTLFKDHWGRARPAEVARFGGDRRFTPAFVPSDQCARNCSFPAGDPAVGFVFVAPAFLVPGRRWRRRAIAGALVLGGVMGIARIAQGAHFLSDVVASGFFVFAASWVLYRWIVVGDGLATLARRLRHPPPSLQRFALLGVVTAVAVAASIAWIDRPLVEYFRTLAPSVKEVFQVITSFGKSTAYLVVAALLALGFGLAARQQEDGARRRWLGVNAARAAFVFVTVGGAGLAGDILKPFFGRARPLLWMNEHIFGFTWHGAHWAYWSFPSGHTITIVALAAALAQVERRGRPFYIAAALLVAASRVVLTEHYLSDVMAGAFIACLACWAARAGFARAGIALSDSP